jgi:Domain of unknown function (DUF4388)
MLSVAGDLALVPLTDVCGWLANRAGSTSLLARHNQTETRFVVRDGKVMQSHSTDPREYLGQHLINFGYISEEQLQRAFETQQETKVPLGRVLVMVDALSLDQLMRVVVFKARESILEAMCWNEGTFRIEVSEKGPDRELDCDPAISLSEVVSEAGARRNMWVEMLRVFPSDGVRVDVLVNPDDIESGLDRRLLKVLQQGRSLGEASLELRAMNFQVYARLYDLFVRNHIRPKVTTSVAQRSVPRLPTPFLQRPAAVITEDLDVAIDVDVDDAPRTAPIPGEGLSPGTYILVRPEMAMDAPHITRPPEASDPAAALRLSLATRNWADAHLISQRILEQDPLNTEAIAAFRVADAQLSRQKSTDQSDLLRIMQLAIDPALVATAHLTSKERYVLSRIDGKRTLQQIVAVSPIQAAELVRIVDAFVARGVLSG